MLVRRRLSHLNENGASRRLDTYLELFSQANFEPMILDLDVSNPIQVFNFLPYSVAGKNAIVEIISHKPDEVVLLGLEFAHLARHLSSQSRTNVSVSLDVCDSAFLVGKSAMAKSFLRGIVTMASQLLLSISVPTQVKKIYISKRDRDADRLVIRNKNTFVLPNLASSELLEIPPIHLPKKVIGVVADFSYPPNFEGLDWFLSKVWPAIPFDFELRIFGPVAPKLELPPGVKFEGYVPLIASIYSSLDITVAPIFRGAGVKNKVVESLMAGRPVLTTEEGSAGIPETSGLFIFKDAKGLLEIIFGPCHPSNLASLSEIMVANRSGFVSARSNVFKEFGRIYLTGR